MRMGLSGFENLPDIYKDIVRNVLEDCDDVLKQGSLKIEAKAVQNAHHITGDLKQSIKAVELDLCHHKVEVGMPYGITEEFGTHNRAAHPFIRPAFYMYEDQIIDKLKDIFEG